VFRSIDADGNGFLDRDELKAGFAAMVSTLLPSALTRKSLITSASAMWCLSGCI
jgi:p-aminobenzoyl-glutamate transporter AbgT